MRESHDPAGLREKTTQIFEEWAKVCNAMADDKMQFVTSLRNTGGLVQSADELP